jgi:RNA polymerase-binding transcription factor DksA
VALRHAEDQVRALELQHDQIVAASVDSNADDEHDPEGATIAWEREQVRALLARARRSAHDLESALDRVAAGTYGVCEVCGNDIPPGRLEARPDATRCVGCSS